MRDDEAKCYMCGRAGSYETGFSIQGTLAAGSDRLYCLECAPTTVKGYTIADLQQLREDGQVERAKYEMAQIEHLGPDVYFHLIGRDNSTE
jgi:hypothetical protein